MNEITFPCTGCGLCCKQVGAAVAVAKELISKGTENEYVKEIASFPFGITKSGACEMLNADNSCSVYDNRPLACQVKKVWEKFHAGNGLPMKDYFISTAMLCNSMMVEANVDDKYFINIENTQLLWKQIK